MRYKTFIIPVLAAGLLFSCNDDKTVAAYTFYYYPEQNLYYNKSSSNYLYSFNGGKSWDSTVLNPGHEPLISGQKVILFSSSPDIWKQNIAHRESYNGILLNFEADVLSIDPLEDVSEKKVAITKPKLSVNKTVAKPKKRNFFDKLLGRKKKPS